MKKINKVIISLGAATLLSTAVSSVYADSQIEPPKNAYLADSPWPMSHRNPYNQASSPNRGLESVDVIETDFKRTVPTSITLAYSNTYTSTGNTVVWGSTLSTVFKLDVNGNTIDRIDSNLKPISEDPLSGAYTLVDSNNRFYVPGDRTISVAEFIY